MRCPACNSEDAYIGFTDIDCVNPSCKHFKNATTATAVATDDAYVEIVKMDRKQGSVLITFKAHDKADPNGQVRVQFVWKINGNSAVATLSNAAQFYVDGVNTDGVTLYRTHWMCVLDGIDPNDAWQLDAEIVY